MFAKQINANYMALNTMKFIWKYKKQTIGLTFSLIIALPSKGPSVGKVHSRSEYGTPLFSNDKQQITPVLIAVIELSLEKNQSNLTNYLIQ